MPIIAYTCKNKHSIKKFFRLVKDAPAVFICEQCDLEMKKMLSAPSSSSKIVIDNGVSARKVEILPNITEINEERSKKDFRKD